MLAAAVRHVLERHAKEWCVETEEVRVESDGSILVISGFMLEIGQRRTSSISTATLPSTSMSLMASLHDVIGRSQKL